MKITDGEKTALTWVAIIAIGGIVVYKIGTSLGLLGSNTATPPSADTNTPSAADYTHSDNFDDQSLASMIAGDWNTFGGDPFDTIFTQIKTYVQTQGDWQTLNATMNSQYGDTVENYIHSWVKHAPWATVTNAELTQLTQYINSLPL